MRTKLALLVVLLIASAMHAEVVRSFDSDIQLQPDGTLDVTETIVMDFGADQRHGIYRTLPVRFNRYANSYTVGLKVLEVTDENSNDRDYTTARMGRDVKIRIGDPDVTVSGVQTYKLRYTVRRAVNFFDNAPEVYWNATDFERSYPIQRATARFRPPEGVEVKSLRLAAFEGPYGSVVFPAVAFAFVYWQWRSHGRDEGAGGAIPVEWNPPANLSPAEVGTLIDEKCDMADICSTLVDLAARGYFKIEEVETAKLLFFSNKDYRFTKSPTPPANDTLLPHEEMFLGAMFEWKGDVRYLSQMKGTFFPNLTGLRNSIYGELMKRRFFTANPDGVRQAYRAAGIIMLIAGIGLAIFTAEAGYVSYGLGVLVSGLIIIGWAPAMPAKTLAGTKAMRECQGFQRFLALVEKDRIATMVQSDPTIFGRLLPYAMVLGVADRWADAFADLLKEPPDWFVPYGSRSHPFSTIYFWHAFGNGMTTMSRTLAAPPPTQSRGGFFSGGGGGGSSGFGGGGFSGGGFGGGGSGSW